MHCYEVIFQLLRDRCIAFYKVPIIHYMPINPYDYDVFVPVQLPSGEEIPLPPIVLGQLGSDPAKKTVCIYGHLDVQPAKLEDGWDTEPFTLVEKEGQHLFMVNSV